MGEQINEERTAETGKRESLDRAVVDGADFFYRDKEFVGVQQSGGACACADCRISGRERLAG